MNEKVSESKSLDMNNFVNIKKLKKFPIYFLQTFLKESRSLGGRGKEFPSWKVQQNSLIASYPQSF